MTKVRAWPSIDERKLLRCAVFLLVLGVAPCWLSGAQEREVLGERAALEGAFQRATERLPAGSRLRATPDPAGALVITLPSASEVALVEVRGEWIRVQWQGRRGWVDRGAALSTEVDFSDVSLDPTDVLTRRHKEQEERWERARSLMRGSRTEQVGRFRVLTDLTPAALRWGQVAELLECFPEMVAQRWRPSSTSGDQGRPAPASSTESVPQSEPGLDAVVLFAEEETYQTYMSQEEDLKGVITGGHAFPGYAALHLETSIGNDGLGLLAHELGHLESARLFGQSLPAWLEEGLAEEMAWSVSSTGDCSRTGGFPQPSREVRTTRPRQVDVTITWPSETIDLACALQGWSDRRPPLPTLFAMTHDELRTHPRRTSFYVAAALTVRLLAEQPARGQRDFTLAEVLGAFLQSQAQGRELLEKLPAEALATEVGRWLARQRALRGQLPTCPRR